MASASESVGAANTRSGGALMTPRRCQSDSITVAPVALIDHPRAERPGLDQLQPDVFGDRRQERRAATDNNRIAEHCSATASDRPRDKHSSPRAAQPIVRP